MISFIPLASSSAGCAYLVKAEGHAPLLLDAGLAYTDLQKLLWSEGVNVADLAGCLISHGHGDHARAVPKLMEAGVDCWASAETMRSEFWPLVKGHRSKTMQPMPQGNIIGPDWWVRGFNAVHDDPGTLGFSVMSRTHQGISREGMQFAHLLYLTDSAYCPYRFEGLTHICVEANFSEEMLKENAMAGRVNVDVAKRTLQTHASIERVVDMLKANDLSKVEEIWLLHLSDHNSDAEAFRLTVQKATGRPTFIAPKRKQAGDSHDSI